MSYGEIVRETDDVIRNMILRDEIVNIVFTVLAVTLIVLMLIMIRQDRKERKARQKADWGTYKPTITDTVQVDRFGTEYRRMGPVGNEERP